MITIVFNYGQLITTIQANISDPFQIPLNQFAQKTLIPLNSVNFIIYFSIIVPLSMYEMWDKNALDVV